MLKQRCELLRSLHVPGTPLLLPNAWDAASARAVVAAGFKAVATTSGGVAASLGYEDHEDAPPEEMFAAAARIANAVDVPVTVDSEAGYKLSPDELIDRLFRAGAAGCNLEDTDHSTHGLVEVEQHAARLAAIREAARARDYGLVINARIDVFLADRARPQSELLELALVRARAYSAAGVDCVYPIFLHDERTIADFVRDANAPVNILAVPQAPVAARLAEIGVARISWGSGIHHRLMEELARILTDIA